MNRDNKVIGLGMDKLSTYLKNRFAQISAITESSDGTYFMVDFAPGTAKLNLLIKEMDAFVKGYIAIHGNPEVAYGFNINCGRNLINNIWYNDPDYGHRIETQIRGRHQKLFVVDVMGATGDYSIFNQDFEYLGEIYMPASEEAEGLDFFAEPDWSSAEKWRASTQLLRPYLKRIVQLVCRSVQRKYLAVPIA